MTKKRILALLMACTLIFTLAACGSQPEAPAADPVEPTQEAPPAEKPAPADQPADNADTEAAATEDQMNLEKAVALFNETFPDATLTEIERDVSATGIHYEIDGLDETHEYKLKINQLGDIVTENAKEHGGRELSDLEYEGFTMDGVISESDAIAAAKGKVEGTVEDYTLDKDDGHLVYSVEVKKSGSDVEVLIDALTGDVLGVDD